jgi:hypothetical protein
MPAQRVVRHGRRKSDSPTRDFDDLCDLVLEGLPESHARALPAGVGASLTGSVPPSGHPLALLEMPAHITACRAGRWLRPSCAGELPGHIEDRYVGRVAELTAAEPLGDAALVLRAAGGSISEPARSRPARPADLLDLGERVGFCGPRALGGVPGGATPQPAAVHEALADVSDPDDAARSRPPRRRGGRGRDGDAAAAPS